MNFSQLLTAVRLQPQAVTIPAEWAQGRACFGGLMAALVYEAMHAKVAPDRPVRSLAITFVGPAEPGVPISFEVELLRDGKAVSSLLGRAVQNGQVVTLVQGSFGAGRDSVVQVSGLAPVPMKSLAESSPELPFIKGVTPSSFATWPCAGALAACRSAVAGHAKWAAGCACAVRMWSRSR